MKLWTYIATRVVLDYQPYWMGVKVSPIGSENLVAIGLISQCP